MVNKIRWSILLVWVLVVFVSATVWGCAIEAVKP